MTDRRSNVASALPAESFGSEKRVVRLDLGYRGTGYRGFAANEGVRTVAGELGAALEKVLGEAPSLTAAGRTDAGVHAIGQVVSFEVSPVALTRTKADSAAAQLERLAASLRKLLGPEIVVTRASLAHDSFDARRSAVARAYEYRIRNAPHADPRYNDLEWHIAGRLDMAAMNAAAAHFVGTHDFSSFCRRRKDRPDATLMRNVFRAGWRAVGEHRLFEIEARAFCQQMVRAIVGQCVAVGRGERAAADVPAVLAARRRDAAAHVAPPHGLTLLTVHYPDEHS